MFFYNVSFPFLLLNVQKSMFIYTRERFIFKTLQGFLQPTPNPPSLWQALQISKRFKYKHFPYI
jgi:hypothetical protein